MMFAHGFDHALSDPARLTRAWKRAEEAGAGPGHWYEDSNALHYCIYQVADMASERHEPAAVGSLPRRDIPSRGMASHHHHPPPPFPPQPPASPRTSTPS